MRGRQNTILILGRLNEATLRLRKLANCRILAGMLTSAMPFGPGDAMPM